MKLQVCDILSDDINDEKEFTDEYNPDKKVIKKVKRIVFTVYGKTEDNKTVIFDVKGYQPYFYLKIPFHWSKSNVKKFFQDKKHGVEIFIRSRYGYNAKYDFLPIKNIHIKEYKELYGFRCKPNKTPETSNFVKLKFTSHEAMKCYSEAIREKYSKLLRDQNDPKKTIPKIFKSWIAMEKCEQCDSHLYESNIHPTIRFIHESKIEPANWIELDLDDGISDSKWILPENSSKEELETIQRKNNTRLYPHVDYYIKDLTMKQIKPIEQDAISKFIIASFDIECDSSHGDFPQANKDFKKLGIELYDAVLQDYHNNEAVLNKKVGEYVRAAFDETKRLNLETQSIFISHVYTVDEKVPCDKSISDIKEYFDEDDFLDEFKNLKARDRVINKITKQLNQMKDISGKVLQVEGDKVIQIGTVFHRYGDAEPYKRHILVIAPEDDLPDDEICADLPNIEVERCKCELDLLLAWTQTIKQVDPEYITGYNIFGFDFSYMLDRIKVYDEISQKQFMNMGKINTIKRQSKGHRGKQCCEKKIKVSKFGTTDYNSYIHMDGRIIYDLQKEVEKTHSLESYKLDNVAAHFMRGKIKKIESFSKSLNGKMFYSSKLYTNEFGNLKQGDYISLRLHSNIGETYYKDNKKLKIFNMVRDQPSYISIESFLHFKDTVDVDGKKKSTWNPSDSEYFKIEWCLMKDDVSPQDIFKKHKTGPKERAEVAKYCIQDCELCINLTLALDIIPNNIAMANVCSVPQSYIYLRGQGVRTFSLISKQCNLKNIRMPTLTRPFHIHDYVKDYSIHGREYVRQKILDEGHWMKDWYLEDILDQIESPPPRAGYEGAIVLDPEPGIYLDDPVGVVDYASLYPSSIIEKNISHDTIILDPKYLEYLKPGDDYETIEYDNYMYIEEEGKVTITKKIDEDQKKITCHFLRRKKGDDMGIIPDVVSQLLSQRKATKKRLKNETNDFKKGVLECLQLQYKLVANSVYGQMGAKTSPIYFNKLAACTTAIGRQRIYDAKWGVQGSEETGTGGWWDSDDPRIGGKALGVVKPPKVIYGDTDSVFIKWSREKRMDDGTIKTLEGMEALEQSIEWGKAAGEWVTKYRLNPTFEEDEERGIKKPQDLEYEKTFYPFILISKKRYVADKYEFDTKSCKRNSMGIVLKRRDNAPIVKHVFGNVIEKIMIDKDLDKTVAWLKQTLQDIRLGKFTMRNFVITKSLRGYYKNPQGIAHKVLADRMGERDPGNKPKAGDRMPFAYRVLPQEMLLDKDNLYKSGPRKGQPKDKKVLQGDRIEDPEYITNNKIPLDYEFYITNQIKNPVKQVLDLEMNEKETELLFKKI